MTSHAEPLSPPAVTLADYPRSPLLMGATAVLLFVSAVANFVLSFGFPSNAPLEWFFNVSASVVMLAGGIALGVVAFASRQRKSRPMAPGKTDAFAMTGLVLSGVTLLMWVVLGGGAFVFKVFTGEDPRYMYDVNGIFWAGLPWMVGIVFGAIGYRRGAQNAVALAALGVGLLLIVPTIASAALYALDIGA